MDAMLNRALVQIMKNQILVMERLSKMSEGRDLRFTNDCFNSLRETRNIIRDLSPSTSQLSRPVLPTNSGTSNPQPDSDAQEMWR